MKNRNRNQEEGFSLAELMIAMGIVLVLMGITTVIFSQALGIRTRESSRTDALTSAQAALNVMSREITNSGYGLADVGDSIHNNGIVLADSSDKRLRIRANIVNTDMVTESVSEDVTYYFDSSSESIVRYDPAQNPHTTYLVNRISEVNFEYYNYANDGTRTPSNTPSSNTGQIEITVIVKLDDVVGQPKGQRVILKSYVTLRNSHYMVNQY